MSHWDTNHDHDGQLNPELSLINLLLISQLLELINCRMRNWDGNLDLPAEATRIRIIRIMGWAINEVD